MTSTTAPISPANRLPLKEIPLGTFVYNIEIKAGGGARLLVQLVITQRSLQKTLVLLI